MYSSSSFLLAVICATLNQAFLVSTLHVYNREASNGKISSGTARETPEEHLKPMNIEEYRKCDFKLCEDDTNYPEKNITNLVTKADVLKKLFGSVTNFNTPFSSRSNEDNEEELCETNETVFHPRVMLNVHKKWKYVVNLDDDRYKQYFQADTCSYSEQANTINAIDNEDQKCNLLGQGLRCRQNYQILTLITYENGSLGFDQFEVPTTCECCNFSKC